MKVLLLTSMSGLGGTETATLRLGKLLVQRGHQVSLASSDGPLRQEAETVGMKWFPISFYRGAFDYLNGLWQLMRLLRQESPDIIHCQMARIVPACAIAAKIASPNSRVFYHARGLEPQTYPKIAKLFDYLGVHIIANCQHEQAKLIRHGFPSNRIAYTYNALPHADGISPKTERSAIHLGTLSRLDKVRAVHRTLPMVKTLIEQGLNVQLYIAGTGEEASALQQQAQDLGIAAVVHFLGGIRDLNAFFANIDILVNTLDCSGDHGAGVGNNILEAGLYSTAVVSYDVAGISEMVADGISGRCIALHDDVAFVQAIAELINHPQLRQQYGQALHQRVHQLCNDDAIYQATIHAYQMGLSS